MSTRKEAAVSIVNMMILAGLQCRGHHQGALTSFCTFQLNQLRAADMVGAADKVILILKKWQDSNRVAG